MNIQYTLKLSLMILPLNEIEEFVRTETYQDDTPIENTYGNAVMLRYANILSYFSDEVSAYLDANWLNPDQIQVETYEVISNTDNVRVYFQLPDGDNQFSMAPYLMAFVEQPVVEIPDPNDFRGTVTQDTVILWEWDQDSTGLYGHYILDETGELIAQIPQGVNLWVETGRDYGTNYTRSLVRYSPDGTGTPTDPVTVRTPIKSTIPANLHRYIIEPRDEYPTESLLPIIEKLRAFQPGVGHGLDLMIGKTKDEDLHVTSVLKASLIGIRYFSIPVYVPVTFDYKIVAEGQEPIWRKEGDIRFVVSAYKRVGLTIRGLGTAFEPISGKWRGGQTFRYSYVDPAAIQEWREQTDLFYNDI